MVRALIIINGYPAGEKFLRQAESLKSALEERGIQADILKNGEVYALVQKDGGISLSLKEKYNFCVYLDKDKYLGYLLEGAGLRLFNSARAVELCDDKMTTYIALKDCGLPLAESIPAPLCYTQGATPNTAFLQAVADQLGFPLVAKKSYGSFGAGVRLVHGIDELEKTEREWLYTPHFYQRYMQSSKGRDVRVIVVGGKALGGMERVAQGDEFRSNIELGSEGRRAELLPEYARVAEQAAAALGLEYCGVDLLETDEGPVLCEVNSNAFFEGFERVTGIQVAKAFAERLDKCVII
ncbi:MAG: RimK family alpha-L-glutamate ligase [Clostridia bacterium]|nr:RimK family alpha-L-glutamate ligase [Clostridia bacterium]